MNQSYRVAVADDEPDMREYLAAILPRLGHRVVAVAEDGKQLVELCRRERPDLVISDIKMPDMDGIAAANQIYQEHPLPVILVSAYCPTELVEPVEADHVMAYLVKPIKQADLGPAIAIAMKRFAQCQSSRKEAADPRQAQRRPNDVLSITLRCNKDFENGNQYLANEDTGVGHHGPQRRDVEALRHVG
jgi:response regulator NasT